MDGWIDRSCNWMYDQNRVMDVEYKHTPCPPACTHTGSVYQYRDRQLHLQPLLVPHMHAPSPDCVMRASPDTHLPPGHLTSQQLVQHLPVAASKQPRTVTPKCCLGGCERKSGTFCLGCAWVQGLADRWLGMCTCLHSGRKLASLDRSLCRCQRTKACRLAQEQHCLMQLNK